MNTNTVTITNIATNESVSSYSDYQLVITNNTDYISDPEVVTNYVNVPGADGFIDLTDVFGQVNYSKRSIKICFSADKDYRNNDSLISTLRNKFEGQKVKVTFGNDTNYYWTGRAKITEATATGRLLQFNLEIPDADPFKYKVAQSTQTVASTTTQQTFTINNGGCKTLIPEIYTENDITIVSGSTSVAIAGSNSWQSNLNIKLSPGTNTFKVASTETAGDVQFRWREASL